MARYAVLYTVQDSRVPGRKGTLQVEGGNIDEARIAAEKKIAEKHPNIFTAISEMVYINSHTEKGTGKEA